MGWRHGVRTGLDLAPDAIALVRVGERGRRRVVVEHRSEPLPEGAVVVSPVERNIVDEAAFDRALRAVAGRYKGPVSVALPDPVARVGLFDVSEVPTRPQEFDRLPPADGDLMPGAVGAGELARHETSRRVADGANEHGRPQR